MTFGHPVFVFILGSFLPTTLRNIPDTPSVHAMGRSQIQEEEVKSKKSPAPHSPILNRLVGLVVKASAPRAEGPRFESRLRRDFFGAESYQ